MMTTYRWSAFAVALGTLAGCQILSGLSGLHERTGMGGGGSGGSSTSSSSSSAGGGSSSTSTSSSSTSTSSSSTSTTSSSSTSTSSSSGSCVANLQTDQHNCGACGHDCGGGECKLGQCQPYVLATASNGGTVSALASNGAHVYWGYVGSANDGRIERCKVGGSAVDQVAINVSPVGLVADSAYVYGYDALGARIVRAAPGEASQLFPAPQKVTRVILTGSKLIWNYPDIGELWSGSIVGEMEGNITATVGDLRFAADSANVYWIAANQIVAKKVPLNPNDPLTAVYGAGGFSNLVADADPTNGYLYFTDSTAAGTVYRAKKNGTTMPASATFATANYTDALLVDESFVYWTNYVDGNCAGVGALAAKAVDGTSAAFPLASDLTGCDPVAQDQNALYYAKGGVIYRVVKPVP